jgi:hypothetical protein
MWSEEFIYRAYIFMIRMIKQIKCLIAQVPGVIPHPLPEVNFLMVEIRWGWAQGIKMLNAQLHIGISTQTKY